jgi:pectate lyase
MSFIAKKNGWICGVVAVCLGVTGGAMAQSSFPGAYGFGANATGGRGGTIYHVTNLNDSGAGSFRDAVSASNRIIVFDVGGYVVLQSPVSVSGNLTIEGQTAPGGGIGLMGREISLSNKSNIIMRNVRMRQGLLDSDTGKSALNMGTASNIILDHCSFAYGQWDSVDAVGTTNVTVQNSIIADPIGQQFGAHVETGPSTFYRNLWVNAHNRQPLAKDNTIYINNIVYDYELGYTTGNTGGHFSHDLINNYFITGPMTTTPSDAWFQMDANQSVYASGNYLDSVNDGVLNGISYNTIDSSGIYLTAPWSPVTATIPALSATDAYASVTASSGAFPRDMVDNFALSDVTSLGLKGQLYKDQNLTGLPNDGYGTIASGTPFVETSSSGIPDYWALANGISTTDPNAGTAMYGTTGYTNVEAYANSLILPAPWSAADLAGTPIQGASSYNSFTQQWLLTGSGQNASSQVSQGQFASTPWTQDGTLAAEVTSVTGSGSAAEGGLLFTGTGAAGTSFVALTQTGSGGLAFVWQTAGGAAQAIQLRRVASPLYLKIVTNAGTYSGYYSTDGTNYTLLGSENVTFPGPITAGLVYASGSASTLGTASFTNVSVSQ